MAEPNYRYMKKLWDNNGTLCVGLPSPVRDKLGWKPGQQVAVAINLKTKKVELELVK